MRLTVTTFLSLDGAPSPWRRNGDATVLIRSAATNKGRRRASGKQVPGHLGRGGMR
jgi:hypothetical protein